MNIFEAWHNEACNRYEKELSKGNYCDPHDFAPEDFTDNDATMQLWIELEEKFYEMYSEKDEEMLGYLIDMLYIEFQKEMDIYLHDIVSDFADSAERSRIGDDAYYGVSHQFYNRR